MNFCGIDLGLTVIKATLFDDSGKEVAKSWRKPKVLRPKKGYYERDTRELVACVRDVLREITAKNEIDSIGLCGYGDGIYLLDKEGKVIDNGILSYDTRAESIIKRWEANGVVDRALELTGQKPFASVAPALLRWYKENREEKYKKIKKVLFCKDFVRYWLTNEVSTDLSDASSCLTNVTTQSYDPEILELFGIEEIYESLPEIKRSYELAGEICERAAESTGLKRTLIAVGSHDIDASACGVGALREGVACMISGTWSINLLVTDRPYISDRWLCRNFVEKGKWLEQASSPASATNLEWFAKNFCTDEQKRAEKEHRSVYEICDEEVKGVKTSIIYHPFLFGSPVQRNAMASFIGIGEKDNKAGIMRALYEGVAFNHRMHMEDLGRAMGIKKIRFTGGGSRSDVWCQIFADVLNREIEVMDKGEAGCFGAAIYGAVASGYLNRIDEAERFMDVKRRYLPSENYDKKYDAYTKSCEALGNIWDLLEQSQ